MKAFPNKGYVEDESGVIGEAHFSGMDLRDYFAAKAMQGIITATVTIDETDYDEDGLAYLSYAISDAMLKARDAK